MSTIFRRFLKNNLLIAGILTLTGGIFFSTFLKDLYHPFFHWLLIYVIAINLLAFWSVAKKKTGKTQAIVILGKLFGIKFFSYLMASILFFAIEGQKNSRITFVILLFCLYSTFTIVEIIALTKYFKTEAQ